MRKNLIPLGGLALAIALVFNPANAKAFTDDSNLAAITDKSPPGETSLLALYAGPTTDLVDKTAPMALNKGDEVAITEEAFNHEAAKLAEKHQGVTHDGATKVFGASFSNTKSPRMSAGDLSELGIVLRL